MGTSKYQKKGIGARFKQRYKLLKCLIFAKIPLTREPPLVHGYWLSQYLAAPSTIIQSAHLTLKPNARKSGINNPRYHHLCFLPSGLQHCLQQWFHCQAGGIFLGLIKWEDNSNLSPTNSLCIMHEHDVNDKNWNRLMKWRVDRRSEAVDTKFLKQHQQLVSLMSKVV